MQRPAIDIRLIALFVIGTLDPHILYMVVLAERTADLARLLGGRVKQQLPHGRFDPLVLR